MARCEEACISTVLRNARIENAIRHHFQRGDFRLVVQLVEYWSTVDEPTPLARLGAIRALIELCQVDAAWARLRSVLNEHPGWIEANLVACELFFRRGWINQARRILSDTESFAPGHDGVLAFRKKLLGVGRTDEPTKASPSVSESLESIRTLLCTGSTLKGLAKLKKVEQNHPEDPDVAQLLWACSGDFSLHDPTIWNDYSKTDQTFSDLANFGEPPPKPPALSEGSIDEMPITGSTPSPFMDLFLHQSDLPEEETMPRGEHTASIRLATSDELARGAGVDFVRLNMARDGDTQVRRVVHRFGDELSDGTPSRLHANLPAEVSSFDLDAYRREMGMSTSMESDYNDFSDLDPMEVEDAELIVLNRPRQRTTTEPDDPTSEELIPDPTTADYNDESILEENGHLQPEPQHPKNPRSKTTAISNLLPWVIVLAALGIIGLLCVIILVMF